MKFTTLTYFATPVWSPDSLIWMVLPLSIEDRFWTVTIKHDLKICYTPITPSGAGKTSNLEFNSLNISLTLYKQGISLVKKLSSWHASTESLLCTKPCEVNHFRFHLWKIPIRHIYYLSTTELSHEAGSINMYVYWSVAMHQGFCIAFLLC